MIKNWLNNILSVNNHNNVNTNDIDQNNKNRAVEFAYLECFLYF